MERYLIVIDLDGILLNNDLKIFLKNKEVIYKFLDKGYMVVFVIGRLFYVIIDIYNEFDLLMFVIIDNGGNIREFKNFKF